MRILIVIPVYNEGKIIKQNLEQLFNYTQANLSGYDFKIVLADNNSNDKTGEIVKKMAEQNNKIIYQYYPQKGKGLAILQTWQKFQDEFDIFVFMDADLATDLSALLPLVEAIKNGYDIAIGSRNLKGSIVTRDLLRKLFSLGYQLLSKIILKTKISDLACGFKAVNKKVVLEIVPRIKNNQFFFDSELVYLAEKRGYKIKEIPIKWAEARKAKESRVNIWHVSWQYFKELLRLRAQK
jgi:hypothetical protein